MSIEFEMFSNQNLSFFVSGVLTSNHLNVFKCSDTGAFYLWCSHWKDDFLFFSIYNDTDNTEYKVTKLNLLGDSQASSHNTKPDLRLKRTNFFNSFVFLRSDWLPVVIINDVKEKEDISTSHKYFSWFMKTMIIGWAPNDWPNNRCLS